MRSILHTAFTTRPGVEPGDEPGVLPERLRLNMADLTPDDVSYQATRAFLNIGSPRRPILSNVLDWTNITYGMDGGDTTCQLVVRALDREKVPGPIPDDEDEHFAQIVEQLTPTTRVQVAVPNGDDGLRLLFEGWPMPITIQWTDRQQSLSITCISKGHEAARTGAGQQIRGRFMRGKPERENNEPSWDPGDPDHKMVDALPATFNPGGRPNRTALAVEMKDGRTTRTIHLWHDDDHPKAQYWTYAQALRTVCMMWMSAAGDVVSVARFFSDTEQFKDATPADSTDPFEARITQRVAAVSVQALNFEDAMVMLCDAAGLHFEIALIPGKPTNRPGGLNGRYSLRIWARADDGLAVEAQAARDKTLMIVPAEHDIPRAAPFFDWGQTPMVERLRQSAAQQATITIDPRDRGLTEFLAGFEEVEVSLLLRPGWEPQPQLDNLASDQAREAGHKFWEDEFPSADSQYKLGRLPSSVYHAMHPDHHTVADVFRLWIFPDDSEIDAGGLARDDDPWTEGKYQTHDPESGKLWWNDELWGGGLASVRTQDWVPRRRPIRETVGRRDRSTTDRSPIVRIHFGMRDANGKPTKEVPAANDPGWVIFTGNVKIANDRLAIHFAEQQVYNSPPFLEDPIVQYRHDKFRAMDAFIEGHFWVQVTGTIPGDSRMRLRIGQTGATGTRTRAQILDWGTDKFQNRKRRGFSNTFLGALPPDDSAFEERNDMPAFIDAAFRRSEQAAGQTVAGNFELFYLDDGIRLGDAISGAFNLGLSFKRWPMVTGIVLTNSKGNQRTKIMLSDLRHNPETGSES